LPGIYGRQFIPFDTVIYIAADNVYLRSRTTLLEFKQESRWLPEVWKQAAFQYSSPKV